MSTSIGNLATFLSMGYDPSGLKLFKSDLAESRQAAVDMIEGMSKAAGRVDPMMKRLSDHVNNVPTAADIQKREALQEEANSLKMFLLTDKERFELRRNADIQHLDMLRQAGTLNESEFKRLSGMAGNFGGGSGKQFNFGMVATQFGFGLQDFTSQLQNSKNMVDGLGRGIMSVSNNVQMMGAAFGPTGLAITAIGGALAGVILPSMIKWLTNSEELEKSTKAAADQYERIADRAEMVSKLQNDKPESIVDKDKNLRADIDASMASQQELTARIAKDRAEVQKINAEEKEAIAKAQARRAQGTEFMEIGAKAARERAEPQLRIDAAETEIKKRAEEEKKARTDLQAIGPLVEKAKTEIDLKDEKEARDKLDTERFKHQGEKFKKLGEEDIKSEEVLQKFRSEGLEKFGTSREKLESKQAREREELDKKLGRNPEKESAMDALGAQHDVEMQKLLVDEEQKRLAQMPKAVDAMSGGRDVNSSEGIRAINRAITGVGEIDTAKQQLNESKKHTKFLEDIARQKAMKVVALSG